MEDQADTFEEVSDIEDDPKHEQLIENIIGLSKPLRIKKPSRTEPTVSVSEYDLVRSIAGNKATVRINELASALKHRAKLVELGKKIKNVGKKTKTLPKPLEKPQAERIRRAVGYAKTRLDLDKWEPVVTSNRAALNLSFPLNADVNFGKDDSSNSGFRVKTELQKKLEEIEKKYEVHVVEQEEDTKVPMTLEELLEFRRNARKMRALQSYREAKARRQNKIKSKKYHRIQKREKMKQQLKEFELLQKTDPEAALKKLEDIEKARAEERFSLRHKSTGQWAKNKQIRAKYDKESRQVLAQQLAISRDLTKKVKVDDSESEDEQEKASEQVKNVKPTDPNNPWVVKTEEEVDNFIKSYRKYWDEQNKQKEIAQNGVTVDELSEQVEENGLVENEKNVEDEQNARKINTLQGTQKKKKKKKTKKSDKPTKRSLEENIKENPKKKLKQSSEWLVTNINDETALESIFDSLEQKVEKTIQKKSREFLKTKNSSKDQKKSQKNEKKKKPKKVDLGIPKPATRPIVDEELLEHAGHENEEISIPPSKELEVLQNILKATSETAPKQKLEVSENIDPEKAIEVQPVSLNTEIPELLTVGEGDSDDDMNDNVVDLAFEDDAVAEEFDRNKAEAIEKSKPKDIDLTLPGWGSWGGKGVKVSKRKSRRFLIKMPQQPIRKDMNKNRLIINEEANEKARLHQVSEVPFPFKTVKDFEASIRAPIGSTFVPEVAHRKLTLPAVRTKMGTIIEPMSDEILIKEGLKGLPIVK